MTLKNAIELFYNSYTGKYVNIVNFVLIMIVINSSGQVSPGDSGSQGIFTYVDR